MSTTQQTVTEQGVIYPDGTEDWNVTRTYGPIDTTEGQEQFIRNYIARLSTLGVKSDGSGIRFVERKAKTTYTEPTDIVIPADEEESETETA